MVHWSYYYKNYIKWYAEKLVRVGTYSNGSITNTETSTAKS